MQHRYYYYNGWDLWGRWVTTVLVILFWFLIFWLIFALVLPSLCFAKVFNRYSCDVLTIYPVVSAITDVDMLASSRFGVQAGLVGGVTQVNRTTAVTRSLILNETCMQRHTRSQMGTSSILLYCLSNK